MAEGFVKLRSYWSPEEANLAKLHLESHGISVELDNAAFVATSWIDANAVGGVKLLVKDTDVDHAERILSQTPGDVLDSPPEGDDNEANWQAEENSDDESSQDSQVLTGFRSLKRPIIWLFLVGPSIAMLIAWFLNEILNELQ